MTRREEIFVRQTIPADFPEIIQLSQKVYPVSTPWSDRQLASHLKVFPEGQLVAERRVDQRVLGTAASLIVLWDDYQRHESWRDFTERGFFTNHNPIHGRTLYGAEVMVDPALQGHGVGTLLYAERQALTERLGLLRIRAGARLRGYHRYARALSPIEYVNRVVAGELVDPTLTFQLRRGFHVFDVVGGYLKQDPESLGYAALIQWLNPALATPSDYGVSNPALAPVAIPIHRRRAKSEVS